MIHWLEHPWRWHVTIALACAALAVAVLANRLYQRELELLEQKVYLTRRFDERQRALAHAQQRKQRVAQEVKEIEAQLQREEDEYKTLRTTLDGILARLRGVDDLRAAVAALTTEYDTLQRELSEYERTRERTP